MIAGLGQRTESPTASKPPSPPPAASVGPQLIPKEQKIVLAQGWNGVFQGGALTRKDLAKIFHSKGSPSTSLEGDSTLLVWENVPFLTPIEKAKDLLKISGKLPSKHKIECPGLPRGSFSYYAFDGQFEGDFNRLHLITDAADQVISAHLVNETPRVARAAAENEFHTYNFINYRTKGAGYMKITHEVTRASASPNVVVVNSVLISPGQQDMRPSNRSGYTPVRPTGTGELRVLEQSRWYVPQPIVNLILHLVSGR